MKVPVIDTTGKETSAIEIPERKTNNALVKELYIDFLARQRTARAKTKKRDEVRGGGRKPWRQKGTGRARIGSIRAPHWTGGGVVWGPTGEETFGGNYSKATRKKSYQDALYLKAEAGKIKTIAELPELKKTKEAATVVKTISTARNLLIVVDDLTKLRSASNLKNVSLRKPGSVTIKDIVDADEIVLVGEAKKLLGATK